MPRTTARLVATHAHSRASGHSLATRGADVFVCGRAGSLCRRAEELDLPVCSLISSYASSPSTACTACVRSCMSWHLPRPLRRQLELQVSRNLLTDRPLGRQKKQRGRTERRGRLGTWSDFFVCLVGKVRKKQHPDWDPEVLFPADKHTRVLGDSRHIPSQPWSYYLKTSNLNDAMPCFFGLFFLLFLGPNGSVACEQNVACVPRVVRANVGCLS